MSSAWIKLVMVTFTTKWSNPCHQHHLWTLLAHEYHNVPSEEHFKIIFANFYVLVVLRKFNFTFAVADPYKISLSFTTYLISEFWKVAYM